MPNVLIVDDSPIDRVLMDGVLKKDPQMTTRQAKNGADALAMLGTALPDVVVTDLQMPEMDGLQLVTAIRIHHPQVPVVLVTAHGSEELAVRALEQGAASYVPKSQLAGNLVTVVNQVVELARDDSAYEALARSLEYAEFRFRAGNDFEATDRLVELVQQLVGSVGVCDTGGQVRLGMALEEAFRLAVLQGNLELTPDVLLTLAGHREGRPAWLLERQREAKFAQRNVFVHVKISQEEARFEIRHQGAPLRLAGTTRAAIPALEDTGERSLILMRAFMDDVQFSADGTCITLVKRKLQR